MALRISLKPHERLIVGGAVLRNGDAKCELIVENHIPILRQKEILREEDANTPCRRIYFAIQLMYVDEGNMLTHHATYWELVQKVIQAAPSCVGLIDQISEQILNTRYYQALKLARKLIAYEKELIDHALSSNGSV